MAAVRLAGGTATVRAAGPRALDRLHVEHSRATELDRRACGTKYGLPPVVRGLWAV